MELTADITAPTNKSVTLTATVSDGTVEFFNGTEWIVGTEYTVNKNGTYQFRVTDEAGNVTQKSIEVANIDKVAPAKPVAVTNIAELTNSDVSVTATFSNDSAVKQYRIGDGKWQDYVGAFSVSENGTIYFRAEDAAGNESTSEFVINNIDKIAPGIPTGFNAIITGYNTKLDWLDASDTGVSGVKGYYVRYGTSDTLTSEGEFIAISEFNFIELAVGTYHYQVKAVDNVGNSSDWSAVESFNILPGAVLNLQSDSDGLSWDAIPGVDGYIVEYSTDNFATVISAEITGNRVDSIALPGGTYQWRVKVIDGEAVSYGENIISQQIAAEPQKLISDADGDMDLFFANANGKWGRGYVAKHSGVKNGWAGTGEQVMLSGKNRLADIFEGSTDANILVMTDDADGDALFVDDIYSAFPDNSEAQARIAAIDEIRAGAGDDVVDLTSQRFEYVGDGVTVYGGLGNDVIWANSGENCLFGDAGNDRIVGGSDNDIIVGGAGNDRMHGGGGVDTFCFGENWGVDTVEQLADGEVILWFETGSEDFWNAETMTYSDGTNRVKVSGVSADAVTLKFGEIETAIAGAFDSFASEKIFEDQEKALLA